MNTGGSVEATADHPFWVKGKGWTVARNLAVGAVIATRAGPGARIVGKQYLNYGRTVFNFEVEDTHSYFVGKDGLWVHNALLVPCNEVAVDTNAIIAVDRGLGAQVDAAIAGRTPLVSQQVVDEYLAGNGASMADLEEFLLSRGGRIVPNGSEADAQALIQEAVSLSNKSGIRVLHLADARIAAAAMRDGVDLVTNDSKLQTILNISRMAGNAIGY